MKEKNMKEKKVLHINLWFAIITIIASLIGI